jgi:methyltransferase
MVTTFLFAAIVFFVAAQRLLELRLSARNEAKLRARGAIEHAPEQLAWMRLVHGGWLVAMIAEVVIFDRAFHPWLAAIALAVFLVGQALRAAAMSALGDRWNVRILTVPGAAPVARGIFRHLRHPNYLGVILEIAALPLVHGAFLTSIVFSALNALVLWGRVRAEERALEASGGYVAKLGSKPRFLPRPFRPKTGERTWTT